MHPLSKQVTEAVPSEGRAFCADVHGKTVYYTERVKHLRDHAPWLIEGLALFLAVELPLLGGTHMEDARAEMKKGNEIRIHLRRPPIAGISAVANIHFTARRKDVPIGNGQQRFPWNTWAPSETLPLAVRMDADRLILYMQGE